MLASGFTHRPKMKSHDRNEKTCHLDIKVKIDLTCIVKRHRLLIWSSYTLISMPWLGKRKRCRNPKEEEGKKKKDDFLGLDLLALVLGSLSLSLSLSHFRGDLYLFGHLYWGSFICWVFYPMRVFQGILLSLWLCFYQWSLCLLFFENLKEHT